MPEVIVTGLSFPEGPRWRGDRLYFSDFYRQAVFSVGPGEAAELVAEVPQQPSGLGWLPNGDLLIVSMRDRRLLRRTADGELREHADLSAIATWHCNDMVVDAAGRAYVGNFGWDTHGDAEPRDATLALVREDGSVEPAAEGLVFPNGSVITPDGRTLIVAETRAQRLTAFDIGEDGRLSGRRIWAEIGPHYPDGISLDAEGAIWVADPRGRCVVRVHEGGRISAEIDTAPRGAFACMLGGDDGQTLFICTATGSGPFAAERREGQIERVRVDVPHAGLP